MALTGTLLADFSSFTKASQDAIVTLKDFESGGEAVAKKLSTVSDSLSGVRIVQQATLAAEAVDRIGGVSKLTEAELAKVGAVATEAAAKLVAMGQSVPPGIQRIADAAKQAAEATQSAVAPTDALGHSWVLRIAEGQLLRDAVREALDVMKEMALFLPELALHGAVVGDVKEAFDHLATSSGHAADVLLGELRAGTHGTIDDFELMKRANKDMAAGLDLTDAQFRLLADGAFALAKATGGSTKDALDAMSDAMVTGRVKGVALLTGKIDLKKAEDAYAASLGGTADQLTTAQKMYADQQAILAKVETRLHALGDQTDSLDEKAQQVHVSWTNFTNDLGTQIAQSPIVAAGFDGIARSLTSAFGNDRQAAIDGIAKVVNELAVDIIDLGIGTVETARVVHTGFAAVETVIDGVALVVVGLVTAIGEVLLAGDRLASSLHLVPPGEVEKVRQTQQFLRDLTGDIAHNTAEAALGVVGLSAFDKTLDTLGGGLLNTRDEVLALGDAHAVAATKTEAHTDTEKKHDDQLGLSAAQAKAYAEAVEHLSVVGTTWRDTLAGVDTGLVDDAEAMLKAGASAKDLEIAWGLLPPVLKAIEDKIKDEALALKLNDKIAEDSAINWATYFKDVAALGGSTFDLLKAKNEAWLQDQIAKHVLAKTDTADFYNWVYAQKSLLDAKDEQTTLQANVRSKDHFEQIATQAEAAYQFAIAHVDRFKTADVEAMRVTAEAARAAADGWTTALDPAIDKTTDKLKQTAAAAQAAKAAIATIQGTTESSDQALIDQGYSGLTGFRTAGELARGFLPDAATIAQRASHGLRDSGGPVEAGKSYLIGGGQAPELFTPGASGFITPGGSAGRSVSVTNYIAVNGTAADVARQVAAEILKTVTQGAQLR